MLSNDSALAAINSIHLGSDPFGDSDLPSPRHARGYHYTSDGSILDIWHWKAVRTDRFFQADDNFFGPPFTVRQCDARYKAGYRQDPSHGDGYSNNIRFFYIDEVTPLRLPLSSRFIRKQDDLQSSNDINSHLMRFSDSQTYSVAADNRLKDGTRIPFTISHGPIQGDRGQVGAKGFWADGYWNVEFSRALDTHSPYDTAIDNGTLLWVASFDHAQTRHSYHLWPIRLRLLSTALTIEKQDNETAR